MTKCEREVLNREIGVLEGLTWVGTMENGCQAVAEALDVVVSKLEKLLKEDAEE